MSPHPHLNNYLEFSSLARNETIPIRIGISIELNADELSYLSSAKQQLSLEILRGQLGRNEDQNQLALTQLLSSKEGKKRLEKNMLDIESHLSKITPPFTLPIQLTIDPKSGNVIQGENQLNQTMVILLERRQPPHKALFSKGGRSCRTCLTG